MCLCRCLYSSLPLHSLCSLCVDALHVRKWKFTKICSKTCTPSTQHEHRHKQNKETFFTRAYPKIVSQYSLSPWKWQNAMLVWTVVIHPVCASHVRRHHRRHECVLRPEQTWINSVSKYSPAGQLVHTSHNGPMANMHGGPFICTKTDHCVRCVSSVEKAEPTGSGRWLLRRCIIRSNVYFRNLFHFC